MPHFDIVHADVTPMLRP